MLNVCAEAVRSVSLGWEEKVSHDFLGAMLCARLYRKHLTETSLIYGMSLLSLSGVKSHAKLLL